MFRLVSLLTFSYSEQRGHTYLQAWKLKKAPNKLTNEQVSKTHRTQPTSFSASCSKAGIGILHGSGPRHDLPYGETESLLVLPLRFPDPEDTPSKRRCHREYFLAQDSLVPRQTAILTL